LTELDAGFEERVRQFPMPHHSTAENVAMNQGISDVARAAVNGWIESPGYASFMSRKDIHVFYFFFLFHS
jgi:hypothetical protein